MHFHSVFEALIAFFCQTNLAHRDCSLSRIRVLFNSTKQEYSKLADSGWFPPDSRHESQIDWRRGAHVRNLPFVAKRYKIFQWEKTPRHCNQPPFLSSMTVHDFASPHILLCFCTRRQYNEFWPFNLTSDGRGTIIMRWVGRGGVGWVMADEWHFCVKGKSPSTEVLVVARRSLFQRADSCLHAV